MYISCSAFFYFACFLKLDQRMLFQNKVFTGQFFTCVLISLLSGMEVDLFVPSFPELIRAFNLTPPLVQLTLSLNFVAYCICSLFAGMLGDRYGKRPILLVGLLIFVLGSFLCMTPHFGMLL